MRNHKKQELEFGRKHDMEKEDGRKRYFLQKKKHHEKFAKINLISIKNLIETFPSGNVRAILNATTTGKKKGIFGRFFGGPVEVNTDRRYRDLKALENAYKAQVANHVQKHSNVYPRGRSKYGDEAIKQATEYVPRFLPIHARNSRIFHNGALQNTPKIPKPPNNNEPQSPKTLNNNNFNLKMFNRQSQPYGLMGTNIIDPRTGTQTSPSQNFDLKMFNRQSQPYGLLGNNIIDPRTAISKPNASTQTNNSTQTREAPDQWTMIGNIAEAMKKNPKENLDVVETHLNTLLRENLKSPNTYPNINAARNALLKAGGGKVDSNTLQRVLRTLMYKGDVKGNIDVKNNASIVRALANAIDRGNHTIASLQIRDMLKHRGVTFENDKYATLNEARTKLEHLAKSKDSSKVIPRMRKALRTVRIEIGRRKP